MQDNPYIMINSATSLIHKHNRMPVQVHLPDQMSSRLHGLSRRCSTNKPSIVVGDLRGIVEGPLARVGAGTETILHFRHLIRLFVQCQIRHL